MGSATGQVPLQKCWGDGGSIIKKFQQGHMRGNMRGHICWEQLLVSLE